MQISKSHILYHYVIGFAITMEGISEAEDFSHTWSYVFLFCFIGMLIFVFTLNSGFPTSYFLRL
jgi:hypothetical protein